MNRNVDNSLLLDKFNSGEINVIASAKVLKRGITLEGLQNIIIMTLENNFHHLEQMIGRVVRYHLGKVGKVFIIVTDETYETRRIYNVQQVKDNKGMVVGQLELYIDRKISSSSI